VEERLPEFVPYLTMEATEVGSLGVRGPEPVWSGRVSVCFENDCVFAHILLERRGMKQPAYCSEFSGLLFREVML
jgi:hypothetical protein